MIARTVRVAVAGGVLALTSGCLWPYIGDIRTDAATHRVIVRADPANMELQGLLEAEVARYRRAHTRHVRVDSAAAARIMLVAGIVPDPARGPPSLRPPTRWAPSCVVPDATEAQAVLLVSSSRPRPEECADDTPSPAAAARLRRGRIGTQFAQQRLVPR